MTAATEARRATQPRAERWRVAAWIALASLGLLVASAASGQGGRRTHGYAHGDGEWRFTAHERSVKVVLLAGSIGAFRDRPYGRLLFEWCENAEIQNLSTVGAGAPQLLRRFRTGVLENPAVPVGWRGHELWLLYGGGLNSVGQPQLTNHATHRLIRLAHRRRVRVVAMTLTPWGAAPDEDERWAGAGGLHAIDSTRAAVDYILGRSSPVEALGTFARSRGAGVARSAPWQPDERPDIAIDLYDAGLRDPEAAPWPIAEARAALRRDPRWQRATAGVEGAALERRLEEDARRLAEAPRHYLRPEYRGFDHIHPNRAGHEVIARAACRQLPPSWGCRCP